MDRLPAWRKSAPGALRGGSTLHAPHFRGGGGPPATSQHRHRALMNLLSPPGLLFIVNSLELGGAEKQVVTLLNHLDTDRFRLHLAYLKPSQRLLPQLDTTKLDTLVCCDVTRGIERRAIRQLGSLIHTRRIDAVVCTN